VDGSGNIYFTDSYQNRVRKVMASTGIINTIAGSGATVYSGDGGAAVSAGINDPEGIAVDNSGNLYIADMRDNRILKVTASTGIISTIAGNGTGGYNGDGIAATSASLSMPGGVAVDGSGNVYIADMYNYRIRKVNISTGIINTIAGNGTNGHSGDGAQPFRLN